MKKLLHQIFPPEFFASPAYVRGLILGLVYLGVLLTELFTFEEFPGVIETFSLPGGHIIAVVLAGLLPLVAVAALPFLISMRLSHWSRRLSAVMVIAFPALWLLIGLWLNIAAPDAQNVGLFGATIPLPVGWWLVVFALLWFWAAILCVKELPARKK